MTLLPSSLPWGWRANYTAPYQLALVRCLNSRQLHSKLLIDALGLCVRKAVPMWHLRHCCATLIPVYRASCVGQLQQRSRVLHVLVMSKSGLQAYCIIANIALEL